MGFRTKQRNSIDIWFFSQLRSEFCQISQSNPSLSYLSIFSSSHLFFLCFTLLTFLHFLNLHLNLLLLHFFLPHKSHICFPLRSFFQLLSLLLLLFFFFFFFTWWQDIIIIIIIIMMMMIRQDFTTKQAHVMTNNKGRELIYIPSRLM